MGYYIEFYIKDCQTKFQYLVYFLGAKITDNFMVIAETEKKAMICGYGIIKT